MRRGGYDPRRGGHTVLSVPQTQLAALIVGRSDAAEMRPVADMIAEHAPDADRRFAPTVTDAVETAFGGGWFPDLVLVCQHWSDECAPSDVRKLFSRLPLARWVVCLGAWCESDGRTRDIWPRAVCVPARAAGDRIRAELEIVAGRRAPLPLTASRDEATHFEAESLAPMEGEGRLVVVISPDREFRRWLREWLNGNGWRPTDDLDGAEAIVHDLDPLCEPSFAAAERLASEFAVPVVGLASLAYPEDLLRLAAVGVREVVSKLSASFELPAALARALRGVSSLGRTAGTRRRAGS